MRTKGDYLIGHEDSEQRPVCLACGVRHDFTGAERIYSSDEDAGALWCAECGRPLLSSSLAVHHANA